MAAPADHDRADPDRAVLERARAELQEVARAVGADAYLSKEDGLEQLPERLTALCDEILW